MKYKLHERFAATVWFLFSLYVCAAFAVLVFSGKNAAASEALQEGVPGFAGLLALYLLVQAPAALLVFSLIQKNRRSTASLENTGCVYEAFFHNRFTVVFELDERGTVTKINEAVSAILGFSQSEAVGSSWNALFSQGATDWTGPQQEKMAEVKVQHQKGYPVYLMLLLVPVKDPHGNISGYLGAARDKTKEKMQASKLKQLSRRYQALFKFHPHFSCMLNPQGEIIEVNEKVKEVLGEGLIGCHFMELIYEKEKSFALEAFERALAGKVVENFDIITDKQGAPVYVEYKSIPISENGTVNGIFLVVKDLTDLNQLKDIIEKDVKVATIVQQSVLSPPFEKKDIRISGHYVPAYNIGGDMYAWYPIDENRYGIIMMDVMGHGVSAALISMSIRSLLEGLVTKLQEPSEVIKELNRHMYQLFNGNQSPLRYFTAIYAMVDVSRKTIRYVNAGHVPGLLIDNERSYYLDSAGVPVGLMEDIHPETLQLDYEGAGARLLLYTDGLLEGLASPSIQEAVQELEKCFRTNRELDIERYVGQFVLKSSSEMQDDISILSVDLP